MEPPERARPSRHLDFRLWLQTRGQYVSLVMSPQASIIYLQPRTLGVSSPTSSLEPAALWGACTSRGDSRHVPWNTGDGVSRELLGAPPNQLWWARLAGLRGELQTRASPGPPLASVSALPDPCPARCLHPWIVSDSQAPLTLWNPEVQGPSALELL